MGQEVRSCSTAIGGDARMWCRGGDSASGVGEPPKPAQMVFALAALAAMFVIPALSAIGKRGSIGGSVRWV